MREKENKSVINFKSGHLASNLITYMGITLTTSRKNYTDKGDVEMRAPIKGKMRNKKMEKELW